MKAITFAGYLATDIAYIFNVRRFVSRSTFQVPKLGYSSCITIKEFALNVSRKQFSKCIPILTENRRCPF